MQSAAMVADKTYRQLATAQNFQSKAQFYLDFVEAENQPASTPQEAARILGESIDFSRKVRSRCATARESCELKRKP